MPVESEEIEVVYDQAQLQLLSARLERSDGEKAQRVDERQRKSRLRFLLIGLALAAIFTAVVVGAVIGTNSNSRKGNITQGLEGSVAPPTGSPSELDGLSASLEPSIGPSIESLVTPAPALPPTISQASQMPSPDLSEFTEVLASGDRMMRAKPSSSPSGRYAFGLSNDGDLLLIDTDSGTIEWSLLGGNATLLTMQIDGNLVLRREDDSVSWNSGTAGSDGATLRLDDSGLLSVAVGDEEPVWARGVARDELIPTPPPILSDPPVATRSPSTSPVADSPIQPGPISVAPIVTTTESPIFSPTRMPSGEPVSKTFRPSPQPTPQPTAAPVNPQTIAPTADVTATPTPDPTLDPFWTPTNTPILSPTESPIRPQTEAPSSQPTIPTITPTFDSEAYVVVLKTGARLYRDNPVASPNNLFFFGLNGNGDMIIYNPSGEILWLVQGDGAFIIEMATSGLMKLRRQDGSTTWQTYNIAGGATLRLDNSGRLFVAVADGLPIWTGGIGA